MFLIARQQMSSSNRDCFEKRSIMAMSSVFVSSGQAHLPNFPVFGLKLTFLELSSKRGCQET